VLSERCISYLTIEHKGVIPTALAERFEGWWYGCDLCQEVCPWNRFAPGPADGRLAERPGRDEEAALMALSEEDFDHHFAGSPVRRIGWSRFRRNLLCARFSIGGDLTPFANDPHELVQAQRAELGC
jgi:epoxyqueuosine reductase